MTNTSGMNEYENVEVPVKIPKTSGKSMIHFEIIQSRDTNNSIPNGINNNEWTHTLSRAEIRQQKEECRTWRRSIIRNWKILKKYVYPVELLDALCTKKFLQREDFGDLNEMNQSLAQDKVLTASYNKIKTQGHFDIFKDAVKCVNPGAHIEWDASDSGELPSHSVIVEITSNNALRTILEQKVKGNVAIDIKDEFLIQRIITVDEHEQIAQDLRNNPVSNKFIQMIIEKKDKRSFDCLVYSLQKFNEKQKNINKINIKTLIDNLCGPSETSDSSNTSNSVKMVQGEMNKSISAHNGCKMTLNLADNNEQEQSSFHKHVEQNVTNMTSYFGQVLGSYQTGTEKGSVIIFLKSLESDMGNRIKQSLKDGSFVKLLDKLFNDKDIRTSLSKGEYKLEVTIEPFEGQVFKEESEYLTVNEMSSLSNLIKANRSFLISQINVMALLKAFNREAIEKFENAGIHEAIEITEKAEVFLDVVDKEGLHEEFYNILQKIRMTYVLDRLQTYQGVCSADYSNMRRNIIQNFDLLVRGIDIDDMKGTFIERKVFDIPMFERLEKQFGENKEQATAAFLIEILKIGREAVVTLVDVLYINAMDTLADKLRVPLKLTTVDEEDADMELSKSEGLLFEGTFRVFVKEMDSYAMEKKEAFEETCPKVLNFAELQPDVILEEDKTGTEFEEKTSVEQESQRSIKDKKKNQIEIEIEMDSHAMEKKEAVEESCLKVLHFSELQPDVKLEKNKARTKIDKKLFVEQESQRLIKDKKKNQVEIETGLKSDGPNWLRQGTPLLQVQGPRPRDKQAVGPPLFYDEDEPFQRSMLGLDRGGHRRPLMEPAPRQTMYSSRSNRSYLLDSPPNRYRQRDHYENRNRGFFVGPRGYDDFDGYWDRYNQGSRGGIDGPWGPVGYAGPRYVNDIYGPRAHQGFDGHRVPVGFDWSRGHSGFDRNRGRGRFDGTRGRDDFDGASFSFGSDRSMGFDDIDGQRSRPGFDGPRGRGSFDGKRGMTDISQCRFRESFRERPICGLMEIE